MIGGTEIDTAITDVIDIDLAIGKRRPTSCCIRDTPQVEDLMIPLRGGYAVRPARTLAA